MTEDRDLYAIPTWRRVRFWVVKEREGSSQVEVEVTTSGTFAVRILPPLGTGGLPRVVYTGTLFAEPSP